MVTKDILTHHQYRTSAPLQNRIDLHAKFTRYQPEIWSWIAGKYPWSEVTRVLEFGCGTGVFWESALPMLREDAQVTLTDISPGMLERSRTRISDSRFTFVLADVDRPLLNGEFDLILSHFMLYHADDPALALRNIKALLGSNGRAAILTAGDFHLKDMDRAAQAVIRKYGLSCSITDETTADSFSEKDADREIPKVFDHVVKYALDDFLDITDLEPLLAYMKSTLRFSCAEEEFYAYFTREMEETIRTEGKFVIAKRVVLYLAH